VSYKLKIFENPA